MRSGSSPIDGTRSHDAAPGGTNPSTAPNGPAAGPRRTDTGPRATAGASGGRRIVAASDRATGDGRTGPPGAFIAAR